MPSETEQLEVLKAKADRKGGQRAEALQAQRSMSSAESAVVVETGFCRCGAEVEIAAVIIDGKRLPMPNPVCDTCAETEDRESRAINSTAPISVEDWLDGLGVNTRKHGTATLESFDDSDSPKALTAAQRFVEELVASSQHDRVRGLYFVGEQTGNGKSHLAVAIIRAVHEARPDLSVVYDPADRLVTRVQDSYGSGTTDDLIEIRRRADLYVLDDPGREKGTTDALRVLCTILDEREGAPTVITSNALPRELGTRYPNDGMWARVASRLGDAVYRYVAVVGGDRRFLS